MSAKSFSIVLGLALVASSPLMAESVLIDNNSPDGSDLSALGMSYTDYSFGSAFANASSIFNSANKLVIVEGGDQQDSNFQLYLSLSQPTILSWVANGGTLLLKDANTSLLSPAFTFGPGTFGAAESDESNTGTVLPGTGLSATPSNQTGNYLSEEDITGSGLTNLVQSANGYSVASASYGNGEIVYSALTDSSYNDNGAGLNESVISYASATRAPEGGSIYTMLGLSLLTIVGALAWKSRSSAMQF